MVNYEEIKGAVEDVYRCYAHGSLSDNPNGAFSYLYEEMNLEDELIEEGSSIKKENYICQTKSAFAYIVYFLYEFLKKGRYTGLYLINCYYRSKEKFACKELEKEMTFIERCYKENFDKFYGPESPIYIPERRKPKNQ